MALNWLFVQVLPILFVCSGVISQNENVEFVKTFYSQKVHTRLTRLVYVNVKRNKIKKKIKHTCMMFSTRESISIFLKVNSQLFKARSFRSK